ncbi:hypothetical protein [Pseudonocardia acidicola]|uniref:Uncharacterized protein n=1 Tax=Pseudonocardia acidicola TaxID=2724939 RepID=A0ABX1SAE5_9PSEU|nr:hypothetical protein [Pseudonocardia acidicola]NMH97321.1 hypothetical protein [Pseudonocardia acidicola]
MQTTSITSQLDGLAHEIVEEDLLAGSTTGRYRAVCGAWVAPTSMTAAPGRPCVACTAALSPAPGLAASEQHSRSVRRAVSGWLRTCSNAVHGSPRRGAPSWT